MTPRATLSKSKEKSRVILSFSEVFDETDADGGIALGKNFENVIVSAAIVPYCLVRKEPFVGVIREIGRAAAIGR